MQQQIQRKKEVKQCELELRTLSRQKENKHCADCGERNPTWVSVNIGCWLCMKCAGYHRTLG